MHFSLATHLGGQGQQLCKQLAVRDVQEALEQHAGGDEVLRTTDREREVHGAVHQEVAPHCG